MTPLTTRKQIRHSCVRANIATGNAFRLERLSKPEECAHGEASAVFWAPRSNPLKNALGDLAGREHLLSFRVRDGNAKRLLPSKDKFNRIKAHKFLPNAPAEA